MLVNLILHSGANAPVLEKRKAKICECFEGERRKLSMDFRCLSEKVFHPHQITFHRMSEWVKMEEGCGRRHRQLRFQTFIMCVLSPSSKTLERGSVGDTRNELYFPNQQRSYFVCARMCDSFMVTEQIQEMSFRKESKYLWMSSNNCFFLVEGESKEIWKQKSRSSTHR